MLETNGWIKLYKRLDKWEWTTCPKTGWFFVKCIFAANFVDGRFCGRVIKRGSFVSSYKNLAEMSGLTTREVRTVLQRLISTNEISVESTSKFTIITITNYCKFQDKPEGYDKPTTNQRQTKDKPTTTIEELKNLRTKEESMYAPDDFANDWNRKMPQLGFSHCKQFSANQNKDFLSLCQSQTKQDFCNMLELVCESEFLSGKNNKGFKATATWVINHDNYFKIINGQYSNGEKEESGIDKFIKNSR